MSPRSQEFIDEARTTLRAARLLLDNDLFARAISSAYYALLYAARAALSEEDLYAKTHRGTWDLFHQTFVAPRRFDAGLYAAARAAQKPREDVDYDAVAVSRQEAEEIVAVAKRFVDAVAEMYAG